MVAVVAVDVVAPAVVDVADEVLDDVEVFDEVELGLELLAGRVEEAPGLVVEVEVGAPDAGCSGTGPAPATMVAAPAAASASAPRKSLLRQRARALPRAVVLLCTFRPTAGLAPGARRSPNTYPPQRFR